MTNFVAAMHRSGVVFILRQSHALHSNFDPRGSRILVRCGGQHFTHHRPRLHVRTASDRRVHIPTRLGPNPSVDPSCFPVDTSLLNSLANAGPLPYRWTPVLRAFADGD
ncbi:hypothetical protein WOLCODRAFT_159023 [Wolfiporia cocos MD-104 SS10]|uniref:Uncharacterized protein n=1 Tax=Wolfiporia cocos (strain MD-104) TaxID=742152 RepID=A0A2H3JP08_WOLCO|nr:hypothetical protein WOLCODRAFT_159023 [Wolfiporia cocos MD-104 SS10]